MSLLYLKYTLEYLVESITKNIIIVITIVIVDICRTPLQYAAANTHHMCVMSLVTAGTNINITDTRGCTPLHYSSAADSEAK